MNGRRARLGLWLIPALAYLLFCVWYTNLGGPLTQAEQQHYVAILRSNCATPARGIGRAVH
jgi:hypothetical protein